MHYNSQQDINIRDQLLTIAEAAGAGHIGSCLSCLDLVSYLVNHRIKKDEDWFILSKGHAALALYVALAQKNEKVAQELQLYLKDGCRLGGHASLDKEFNINASTGSLGMGVGIGTGYAWAQKLRNASGRTFVLVGDGELDEGIVWECLRFSIRHDLYHLVIIIDSNGWRGYDRAIPVEPDVFRSMGFQVRQFDGHDNNEISNAFDELFSVPTVLIAKTIKGKGLPGYEDTLESHYIKISNGLAK
jgi:transketolase